MAGPGWLGLAQPMWAELDPAPKNKKNKKIKNRKCRYKNFACLRELYFFFNLFTYIRIMNKKRKRKRKHTNFLVATNFYQR
jgi:hypothetical protein